MSKLINAMNKALSINSNTSNALEIGSTPGYSEVFVNGIGFLARRISEKSGPSKRYRTIVGDEVVIFTKSDFNFETKIDDKSASKLMFQELCDFVGEEYLVPKFELNVLKFVNKKGKEVIKITRDKNVVLNRKTEQKFTSTLKNKELVKRAYVSARYAIPMQNLTIERAQLLLSAN
jgi:hypothetical protein